MQLEMYSHGKDDDDGFLPDLHVDVTELQVELGLIFLYKTKAE